MFAEAVVETVEEVFEGFPVKACLNGVAVSDLTLLVAFVTNFHVYVDGGLLDVDVEVVFTGFDVIHSGVTDGRLDEVRKVGFDDEGFGTLHIVLERECEGIFGNVGECGQEREIVFFLIFAVVQDFLLVECDFVAQEVGECGRLLRKRSCRLQSYR